MQQIKTLYLHDKIYPDFLKQIHKPPQKLFYIGDISLLGKTCISVVGTRKISEYGKYAAEKIIEELSIFDVVIVSGLAKGVDTVAHQSALKFNLPTIAVLGSGLNNIYPKENQNLVDRIIEQNGLILSEFELDETPTKYTFPLRNRIISGLSVATLVVEAPEKSGALLTARLALEQNRDVFVIPSDIDRENSHGCLKLLQNSGAYPITCGQDLIDYLKKPQLLIKEKKSTAPIKNTLPQNDLFDLTSDQKSILNCLSKTRSSSLDSVCEKTKLPPQNILSSLSILEIYGLVKTKSGKYLANI